MPWAKDNTPWGPLEQSYKLPTKQRIAERYAEAQARCPYDLKDWLEFTDEQNIEYGRIVTHEKPFLGEWWYTIYPEQFAIRKYQQYEEYIAECVDTFISNFDSFLEGLRAWQDRS